MSYSDDGSSDDDSSCCSSKLNNLPHLCHLTCPALIHVILPLPFPLSSFALIRALTHAFVLVLTHALVIPIVFVLTHAPIHVVSGVWAPRKIENALFFEGTVHPFLLIILVDCLLLH